MKAISPDLATENLIQTDSAGLSTFAEIRQWAGLSQRDMARFVSRETGDYISQTAICFIERGERVPPACYLRAIRILTGEELDAATLALLDARRAPGETRAACLRRILEER